MKDNSSHPFYLLLKEWTTTAPVCYASEEAPFKLTCLCAHATSLLKWLEPYSLLMTSWDSLTCLLSCFPACPFTTQPFTFYLPSFQTNTYIESTLERRGTSLGLHSLGQLVTYSAQWAAGANGINLWKRNWPTKNSCKATLMKLKWMVRSTTQTKFLIKITPFNRLSWIKKTRNTIALEETHKN